MTEEYEFPDLSLSDRLYLQELEDIHGKERVIGWLRGKVDIPLAHKFEDDFDEDAYFEAAREHYVDTGEASVEDLVRCPHPECEFETDDLGSLVTFVEVGEHADEHDDVELQRSENGWQLRYTGEGV